MPTLLTIREIQIKTTVRYHLTLVRMAIVKHCKEPRLERVWRSEDPPSMLECQLGTATKETVPAYEVTSVISESVRPCGL